MHPVSATDEVRRESTKVISLRCAHALFANQVRREVAPNARESVLARFKSRVLAESNVNAGTASEFFDFLLSDGNFDDEKAERIGHVAGYVVGHESLTDELTSGIVTIIAAGCPNATLEELVKAIHEEAQDFGVPPADLLEISARAVEDAAARVCAAFRG